MSSSTGSVPSGRHGRNRPGVFSCLPRRPGRWGSAKRTVTPVRFSCRPVSSPGSWVSVLRMGSYMRSTAAVDPSGAARAAGALDPRARRGAIRRLLDEVAFPLSRNPAVLDFPGTRMQALPHRESGQADPPRSCEGKAGKNDGRPFCPLSADRFRLAGYGLLAMPDTHLHMKYPASRHWRQCPAFLGTMNLAEVRFVLYPWS